MHKAKKTRRNYKHSKKQVKNAKSCKRGDTDESIRIRRLAHEIKILNNKSAKLKHKAEGAN
jgi:hypothetical protein